MLDTLIRGAVVVNATGSVRADVGLQAGQVVVMGRDLTLAAQTVLDADGLHLLPGLIDPHVHLNEPGRSEWEGLATGTRALAAGGVTTFVDMPLNSSPVVTTVAAFRQKQALIAQKSLINGYQWGGLIPGHLDDLAPLHAAGVLGFKAFMSDSGLAEFPAADDRTLLAGMKIIAQLGSLLAVHAESDSLTHGLAQQAQANGDTSIAAYLATRPPVAEWEAISRALLYARETGCTLYVVHTSTAQGAALIAQARAHGQDVTCETCPHYLVLSEDDMLRLGAVAKCAPPLRSPAEREALWAALQRGEIQIIGSDHSPALPDMKTSPDFFQVWGGISGAQHTLSLLLTFGHFARGLSLEQIVGLTSTHAARRFGLTGKGYIGVGADADLVLVNPEDRYEVSADTLHYRHRQSPYLGLTLHGRVVRTLVKGRTVYHEGTFYE